MSKIANSDGPVSPQVNPDRSTNPNPQDKINHVESFSGRIRTLIGDAGNLGVELSQIVTQNMPQVAKDVAQATQVATKNIKREFLQGANFVAARTLESLAGDKKSIGSFTDELKKVTPLIGASTRYAQAWRKYHSGKDTDNELLINEAKVEVLVAFAEAGLDIGLIGASKVVASSRIAGRALAWLTTLRASSSIDSLRLDIIEKAVASILSNKKADQLVEAFLKSVVPLPKD